MMNVAKTHRYLNLKYDNLFNKTRRSLAYRRLWIFYNELRMGYIECPFRNSPPINVLREAMKDNALMFQKGTVGILKNSIFWNANGQECLENDREGTIYFGRIILLMVSQFGISYEEISKITHIEDPEECVRSLFLRLVQLGLVYTKRIDAIVEKETCRHDLIDMLVRTFNVKTHTARKFEDGHLIYSIVKNLLLTESSNADKKSLEVFYRQEYMEENDTDSIDIDKMVEMYIYAIDTISDEILIREIRMTGGIGGGWN